MSRKTLETMIATQPVTQTGTLGEALKAALAKQSK